MSIILLLTALFVGIVGLFLLLRLALGKFSGWKLSEKVAATQVVLPFAAATFALNALFGTNLEKPSKIMAALFTLIAGLLAIVKQVAANIEAHRAGFTEGEAVSWKDVLGKIVGA